MLNRKDTICIALRSDQSMAGWLVAELNQGVPCHYKLAFEQFETRLYWWKGVRENMRHALARNSALWFDSHRLLVTGSQTVFLLVHNPPTLPQYILKGRRMWKEEKINEQPSTIVNSSSEDDWLCDDCTLLEEDGCSGQWERLAEARPWLPVQPGHWAARLVEGLLRARWPDQVLQETIRKEVPGAEPRPRDLARCQPQGLRGWPGLNVSHPVFIQGYLLTAVSEHNMRICFY